MAERHLVRVQEKGQVTLPTELRKRLGIKKGDLVAVTETPEGLLITPQEVTPARHLGLVGVPLRERGLSPEAPPTPSSEEQARPLDERYSIQARE
jgi:AbrB family looped-hinge helix DNA binding protein